MSIGGDHQDALRAVIARATTDLEFRQRLLRDPDGAIAEVTGAPVPVRIKFVEKDPSVDVQIVLPDYLPGGSELQPGELEEVAGGTNWCELSCLATTED